jgi:hypothetical protein
MIKLFAFFFVNITDAHSKYLVSHVTIHFIGDSREIIFEKQAETHSTAAEKSARPAC